MCAGIADWRMIAADIAAGLGAVRTGRTWQARCPAHRDRTPSLAIAEADDGRPLVHCHAGCPQDAVIAALRNAGLWNSNGAVELTPEHREAVALRAAQREAEESEKRERAREIWRRGRPIFGTPAATYLRGRELGPDCILYPNCGSHWPITLRWTDDADMLPAHPPRPGMIAAIADAGTGLVTAAHRVIFRDGKPLTGPDGEKVKLALGPIAGNAWRPCTPPDPEGRWGLAEGIESAMAAIQLFRIPVWAAIAASNMPNVRPPAWARDVTIFADNDANGAGITAAAEALHRVRSLPHVRAARVWCAPTTGQDVADLLREIPYATR